MNRFLEIKNIIEKCKEWGEDYFLSPNDIDFMIDRIEIQNDRIENLERALEKCKEQRNRWYANGCVVDDGDFEAMDKELDE